jgi:hypothetical protein
LLEPGTAGRTLRWSTIGPTGATAMMRERAEEYRRCAQDCLVMARAASTPEGRPALVHMAETWQRLADEQDHENTDLNLHGIPPPIGPVGDRPVAQQQQQVQPKDGDEKD